MPPPADASHRHDALIIGGGVAGLCVALSLPEDMRVALLCKGDSNASSQAQGGIAAVTSAEDSVASHIDDTLRAGAGLCRAEAVEALAAGGADAIRWLESQGVDFSRDADRAPHLAREGGHSRRRILHVEDATGAALMTALAARVAGRPNIQRYQDYPAVDLHRDGDRCLGVYALNRSRGRVEAFNARHTVLATGGASRAWLYATAPPSASGDGMAMAWRAGCSLVNMEFNQFHPTCFYQPGGEGFLISEAARGEGARLLLPDGERFMPRHDPRAELASRDVVAQAMDQEMKRLGADCLFLDMRHLDAALIARQFPNLRRRCADAGVDVARQLIPVVPAAHYTCGGVMTEADGRCELRGLSAVGETAWSGVHGANRLASNSLLECLVFGRAAAARIARREDAEAPDMPPWDESQVGASDEAITVAHDWEELRRCMWDYVGIVRSDARLKQAQARLKVIAAEVGDYYARYKVSRDLLELRNLCDVAALIVRSAMARRESRGLHRSLDHPETEAEARNTTLPGRRD